MKNVKYYAGLFDADGSFGLGLNKVDEDKYRVQLEATLYQKEDYSNVLSTLANAFDVDVTIVGNVKSVRLRGNKAMRFMEQVKNHLVVKRALVEWLLPLKNTYYTKDELVNLKQQQTEKRSQLFVVKPFPSRQWFAGYFDGDGCISSSFRKVDGNLEFKFSVVSHVSQAFGLELLNKYYKGFITQQGDTLRWNFSLGQSKAEQVLPILSKHCVIKKAQVGFALGVIRSGKHFKKNGATYESNFELHKKLQTLKQVPATTD